MSYLRKVLLLLGDSLMYLAAVFAVLALRFGWPIPHDVVQAHRMPFALLYVLWVIILYVYNLYDAKYARPTTQATRNILLGIGTCLLAGFLLFYLVPSSVTPKTNLLLLVGIFGGLFFVWRLCFFRIFTNNFKTTVATIGISKEISEFTHEILKNPHLGYQILGSFTTLREILSKETKPDMVVYESHLSSGDIALLAGTHVRGLHVRDAFQIILYRIPVALVDDTLALRIMEKSQNILYRGVTRLLEILFALVLLIVALPFLIIASLAILFEDGGPIFYRQDRVGIRGKVFRIIKLRSMRVGAESNGAKWADKKDQRVTKVGHILRVSHLDEVPQMLNVLRGDIALVGPRPERPEFVTTLEQEIPYYFLRHIIKPGFTGWAQIMFRYARSVMDSQEKFEYDLYYIKNRGFFLDIGIILKTVQIIFLH